MEIKIVLNICLGNVNIENETRPIRGMIIDYVHNCLDTGFVQLFFQI